MLIGIRLGCLLLGKYRSAQLFQLRLLFGQHVREDHDQHFQGFLFAEAGKAPKVLAYAFQRKPELTTRLHGNRLKKVLISAADTFHLETHFFK